LLATGLALYRHRPAGSKSDSARGCTPAGNPYIECCRATDYGDKRSTA